MKVLHIAKSLLSNPYLLAYLFLWPFVIGLLIASFQLVFTLAQVETFDEKPEKIKKRMTKMTKEEIFVRKTLFGTAKDLKELKVCRWEEDPKSSVHNDSDCKYDNMDVSISVSNPLDYDISLYENLFKGVSRRLHVCKGCYSSITLFPKTSKKEKPKLVIKGGLGALSYYLLGLKKRVQLVDYYISARKKIEEYKGILGETYLYLNGTREPVQVNEWRKGALLVVHVAGIILVAIWLAVKAHKRVLDYFSKNGALLPLVATCGKQKFYKAIWFITILRVFCFLIASVPVSIFAIKGALKYGDLNTFQDLSYILTWIVCFMCGASLLAVISSIGELKDRETVFGWAYKFVPFFLAFFGFFIWCFLAFLGGDLLGGLKDFISIIPVIGLIPIIIAPVISTPPLVLFVHGLICFFSVLFLLKKNAYWFASHLESL